MSEAAAALEALGWEEKVPRLSPSIAYVFDKESPLHAWTQHRRLGNRAKPATDPQEKGRLYHAMVLGGASIEVIEANDFRTPAARVLRDDARSVGKIPVVTPKYEAAQIAVERILERIAKLGYALPEGGATEERVEWFEITADGEEVACSGQLDYLRADRQQVIDLKFVDGSAHPDTCTRRIADGPAVMQDAAYRSAVETLYPEVCGRVEMLFLFCQTVEPFDVTPIECGGSMREIGVGRWTRTVERWANCLSKGREAKHWPGYTRGPVRVEAPPWLLKRELMEG